MQYPASMQPTHARWERVSPPTDIPAHTNGVNSTQKPITSQKADQNDDTEMADTQSLAQTKEPTSIKPEPETIFTPVNPIYSRNYLIVDTVYESPPIGNAAGIPGPDSNNYDIGFNGLSSISDEIRDLLPEDCRVAFERAAEGEREWKGRWGCEEVDGRRANLVIHKGFIGPP